MLSQSPDEAFEIEMRVLKRSHRKDAETSFPVLIEKVSKVYKVQPGHLQFMERRKHKLVE